MKITDMLISGVLRKGLLYEARNVDVDFDIPSTQENEQGKLEPVVIKVKCKVEHMSLKVEKGRE